MNQLRAFRSRVPISRSRLGALAGVDGQTIYRIENGAQPQLATAFALAHSLTELLGELVRVEDLFPPPAEVAS